LAKTEDVKQYMDFGLKNFFAAYEGKAITLLSGEKIEVKRLLNSELTVAETKRLQGDIAFETAGGIIVNIEIEAQLSLYDLRRFQCYNAEYEYKHEKEVRTIIFTTGKPTGKSCGGASLQFTPDIINLSDIDGDDLLEQLRKQVAGGAVNDLALVLLHLCKSGRSPEEMFTESVNITVQAYPDDEKIQSSIFTAGLMLIGKKVSKIDLSRLKGEVIMLLEKSPAFQWIEERGWEKGWEEGIKTGIEKGREEGIERGREEGIERGIEKGKLDTAREMLSRNIPIDVVAACVKMQENELRKILLR
jgi:hypothetical protein